MFPLSNVTEDRALIFFPFFSLCVISDFFPLLLLGFAPPSPSFSHPTTQIWQLHATFTVISAAPHLFLFFFFSSKQSLNQRVATLCFLSNSQ